MIDTAETGDLSPAKAPAQHKLMSIASSMPIDRGSHADDDDGNVALCQAHNYWMNAAKVARQLCE